MTSDEFIRCVDDAELLIALSRLQRELTERIERRIAASQLGEDFVDEVSNHCLDIVGNASACTRCEVRPLD
jgi:hypothetical protein